MSSTWYYNRAVVMVVGSILCVGLRPAKAEGIGESGRKAVIPYPNAADVVAQVKAARQRSDQVYALATSSYTRAAADTLLAVACDKKASEGARDYAAMGLGHYESAMPSNLHAFIRTRLCACMKEERGDTPVGIIRMLIGLGETAVVADAIGDGYRGHPMEMEFLLLIPAQKACDRLWELYRAAKPGDRRRQFEIGTALLQRHDTRGCDILMDFLRPNDKINAFLRKDIYLTLLRALHPPEESSFADHQERIPELMAWWQTNRDTIRANGGVPVCTVITSIYTSTITSNAAVRYTAQGTTPSCLYDNFLAPDDAMRYISQGMTVEVFVVTADLVACLRSYSKELRDKPYNTLADTLAQRAKKPVISTVDEFDVDKFDRGNRARLEWGVIRLLEQGKAFIRDAEGNRVGTYRLDITGGAVGYHFFYLPDWTLFFKHMDFIT